MIEKKKLILLPFQIEGELDDAPVKTVRHSKHWELLIPLGKDATASFIVDEDGREYLEKNGYILNIFNN